MESIPSEAGGRLPDFMISRHSLQNPPYPLKFCVYLRRISGPCTMKKLSLFPLLLVSLACNSQYITRGPDVGEIYFGGPTINYYTMGIYYSTNSGQSAVCVINQNISAIGLGSADMTKGGLYGCDYSNLYYSNNFGYPGSWSIRSGESNCNIKSGRVPGEIYPHCSRHSNDYGYNYVFHLLNGFYGNLIDYEIGVVPGTGYFLVYKTAIIDSIYLLYSTDNFDNLINQNRINYGQGHDIQLSRGSKNGELYFFNFNLSELLFSNDDGVTITKVNKLNFGGSVYNDYMGGRSEGEIYLIQDYYSPPSNRQIYILHSNDYGQTFEVFNPVRFGKQFLYANFSAKALRHEVVSAGTKLLPNPQSGPKPLKVQFYDYSIGRVKQWRWDFNNDGTIDSYKQNPWYIYNTAGDYTVKLTVLTLNGDSSNSFTRTNYIHVTESSADGDGGNPKDIADISISNYPNPFKDGTCFEVTGDEAIPEGLNIEIYDMQGRLVKTLPVKNQILWDGTDNNQERLSPGVYVYRVPGPYPTAGKVVLLR
jgi:PKD repeat protein